MQRAFHWSQLGLTDKKRISVQPVPKSTRGRPESGVNAAARELGIDGVALGHLRCGPSARGDRTILGRVLRTLGELNAGRDRGANRLEAVQQSARHGGSSKFRDLLRVLRVAYRSDNPVRLATFGTLRFPSTFST